jgi:hypothetical protein
MDGPYSSVVRTNAPDNEVTRLKDQLEFAEEELRKAALTINALEGERDSLKRECKKIQEEAEKRERHENWLSWSIDMAGILLPLLVVLAPRIASTRSALWSAIQDSSGKGIFLVPIMMLCIDAILRWVRLRSYKGGSVLTTFRIVSLMQAGLSFIILFTAAATLEVTIVPTSLTARSITTITLACLVTGAIYSTAGFIFSIIHN